MNVAENIGYGLKLRKVPRGEIKKKVAQMLELVQLEGYEKESLPNSRAVRNRELPLREHW